MKITLKENFYFIIDRQFLVSYSILNTVGGIVTEENYFEERELLREAFDGVGFDARDAVRIIGRHDAARWVEILAGMASLGFVVRKGEGVLSSGQDAPHTLPAGAPVQGERERLHHRGIKENLRRLEDTARALCAWYKPEQRFTFQDLNRELHLNPSLVTRLFALLRQYEVLGENQSTPKQYWLIWVDVPDAWKPAVEPPPLPPKTAAITSSEEVARILAMPGIQAILQEDIFGSLFEESRRRPRK